MEYNGPNYATNPYLRQHKWAFLFFLEVMPNNYTPEMLL